MRKLIVSNLISVDGYASGRGDDVMALPFDTTFSDYNLEFMRAADTLVFGAVTFRGMVGYCLQSLMTPLKVTSSGPSLNAIERWSTWWSPTA